MRQGKVACGERRGENKTPQTGQPAQACSIKVTHKQIVITKDTVDEKEQQETPK
jgi:hypothetical protein